jgi:opacity protein-like surface antigen
MNVKYLVAAMALLAASAAYAGPYVGAEVNSTSVEAVSFDDTFKNFDERSTGYGLTAGWKFGNLAAEVQYIKPDSLSSDEGLTVDGDGWTISGLGFVPLGTKWSLFGEVGYYDFSTDVSIDEQESEKFDGESGILFGAGVNWNFWNNVNARVGATLYDSDISSINQVDFGLLYEFK